MARKPDYDVSGTVHMDHLQSRLVSCNEPIPSVRELYSVRPYRTRVVWPTNEDSKVFAKDVCDDQHVVVSKRPNLVDRNDATQLYSNGTCPDYV